MVSDYEVAHDILPAWYTKRMMSDDWLFGLLSVSGDILVINKITGLSDNGDWIDVQLALESELNVKIKNNSCIFAVSDDRREASVRVKAIATAFELQTS